MNCRSREEYLRRLERELKARWLPCRRILEEASAHLDDAAASKRREGLSLSEAEAGAIAAFGAPEVVAGNFASSYDRKRQLVLFTAAVAWGLAIAYIDSRPTWDDAGVTALGLLVGAALPAVLAPGRAWLWALAVGIWIPLSAILRGPSPAHVAMLLVLAFPFVGACAGSAVRKMQ